MKTKQGWDESKQNLTDYLQVGDEVDDDIVDYFIEVLPPQIQTPSVIQIGEPYDNTPEGDTYTTIKKVASKWVYAGILTTEAAIKGDFYTQQLNILNPIAKNFIMFKDDGGHETQWMTLNLKSISAIEAFLSAYKYLLDE